MLDVAGGSADNRIMTNDETLKTIRTIIRSHVPDPSYRLFVFGSRATGTARKFSDMDIGIQGDKPVPSAAYRKPPGTRRTPGVTNIYPSYSGLHPPAGGEKAD